MATTTKLDKTTPKKGTRYETYGTSSYAILHAPVRDKKYGTNPDGSLKRPTYRQTVIYPSADDPALKELKSVIRKNGISKKIREVLDEDKNETGEYSFTFTRTAFEDEETGKFTNAPQVVDHGNNTIPKDKLIGNGSKIKVSYNVKTSRGTAGEKNSLQLLGVQVLKLVEYKPTPLFSAVDIVEESTDDTEESPASF